jgi:hypothetical protein
MAAEAGTGPADFVIPDALPVLPLRDAVVLPLTAVPLTVGALAPSSSSTTSCAATGSWPSWPSATP